MVKKRISLQEEANFYDLDSAFQKDRKKEEKEGGNKEYFYKNLIKKKGYKWYLTTERWEALKNIKILGASCRDPMTNQKSNCLLPHHKTYKNIGTDKEIADLTLTSLKYHEAFHKKFQYKQKDHCFYNKEGDKK